MVYLRTILNDHPLLFTNVYGDSTTPLEKVAPPEESSASSICFLSQPTHLKLLENLKSPLWIIAEIFWNKNSESIKNAAQKLNASILTCRNLQLAMAHILNYFDRSQSLLAYPLGISPSSWVHPSAQIELGVTIAPFSTIGPNVKIGAGTIIGSHCTIEGDVEIGSNCLLEGHIFIGRQCKVGNACRIKPFASIGSDGYGYAPSADGILKIPQIGIVVLEEQVDIGSGTCIDRATLTHTRIGKGTKIDNLVHIAHNCDIGKYCFITAGFAMAGSSKIGDFFMTGGSTSVGDHVVIAEKVTLAGATVVTSNIEKSGAYGGNPVQPMNDYLRTRSTLAKLPSLRKQMTRVLKLLGLED